MKEYVLVYLYIYKIQINDKIFNLNRFYNAFIGTSSGEVAIVDLYEKTKPKITKRIKISNTKSPVPLVCFNNRLDSIFAADYDGNLSKIKLKT